MPPNAISAVGDIPYMIAFGISIFLFMIAYIVFWRRVIFVWYALVLLSPFTGLVLRLNEFGWTKDIQYISAIAAPYADFVGLFLLVLVAGHVIARAYKKTFSWNLEARSAGWHFFWPFLLVAFLSIAQVEPDARLSAFKYFLRPILFFYLVWVVVPQQAIAGKRALKTSMLIFLSTGVVAALMGAVSLFTNEAAFGFLARAMPIGWGAWHPFGWNQNILAEALVATVPLSAYFMLRAEGERARKRYFVCFFIMTAITLLTFSRAAWIALAVQSIVYAIWYKRLSWRAAARSGGILLALLLPLIIYMAVFVRSPLVISSNATRFDLTGIAWSAFTRHPLFGNGVGSFVPIVEETRVFGIEYGDPLDAHGIVQKLIAEVGLFGLVAFFIFMVWCLNRLWRAWRARPDNSASQALFMCLFLSALGSFIFQLFNTSYYGAHLWLPVGLALAAARLFETHQP